MLTVCSHERQEPNTRLAPPLVPGGLVACHGVPRVQEQGRLPGQATGRGRTMTEASVGFAGNLTDDPEVRYTDGGIARAMFRAAVSGRRDREAVVLHRDRVARPGRARRAVPSRRAARLATARYATSLRAASRRRQIITRIISDMGYHFLNPAIQGFDVRKPPILVYACHGRAWQLVALEWAFPSSRSPAAAGATYGLRPGLPVPRRHLRGRRHPGPVPVAQPPDGFEVQPLAPQAGHPPRVELLAQPRRPV
jgi:hypothetical protein